MKPNSYTKYVDFDQFWRDIRLKYFVRQLKSRHPNGETQSTSETNSSSSDSSFDPKLYVKSEWDPDPIEEHIKLALNTFEKELNELFTLAHKEHFKGNISMTDLHYAISKKWQNFTCHKHR